MLSIKEISKKRLKDKIGQRDNGALVNFLRIFSLPFTIIAYYLRITANQISLFSFLVIAIASVFISLKDYKMSIIGCIILIFWFILDLVDGEMSRLRNSQSIKGEFLEILNHDIAIPLIYFALGIKAYNHFNSILFVYIGSFSAIALFFIGLLRSNKYMVVIRLMQKGKKIKIPKKEVTFSLSTKGSISYFILSLLDTGKIVLYLLVLSILNLLHYAVFFYAPFIFVVMIAKLYIEYKSGFKEFGLK